MTEEELLKQFQEIEDTFNAAVVSNNVRNISNCISSDWVLVDAQGGIINNLRKLTTRGGQDEKVVHFNFSTKE